MACFYRALELKPQYADALANLGLAQGELGQQAAAVATLRRALELKPDHRGALGRLAALLLRDGQPAEGATFYARALERFSSSEGWTGLGNLQLTAGRATEAEAAYRQALQLNDRHAPAVFNLGSALQEQHRVDDARQQFRRAAELRPQQALWRLRAAAASPAVFASRDEIEAYCTGLKAELDRWITAPPKAT